MRTVGNGKGPQQEGLKLKRGGSKTSAEPTRRKWLVSFLLFPIFEYENHMSWLRVAHGSQSHSYLCVYLFFSILKRRLTFQSHTRLSITRLIPTPTRRISKKKKMWRGCALKPKGIKRHCFLPGPLPPPARKRGILTATGSGWNGSVGCDRCVLPSCCCVRALKFTVSVNSRYILHKV